MTIMIEIRYYGCFCALVLNERDAKYYIDTMRKQYKCQDASAYTTKTMHVTYKID